MEQRIEHKPLQLRNHGRNRRPRNSRSPFRRLSVCVWVLGLFVLTVPASAYIVVLKDGSQITTKEKYTIDGDKAILILPSGTQAFYNANEIDIPKTEELNKLDYGTARLIEGKETTQLATDVRLNEETTLRDLVGSGGRSLALPPVRKRPKATDDAAPRLDGDIPLTTAGFVDLVKLPKLPYPNTNISGEVLRYLKGQGNDDIRIYKGSQEDRLLLEFIAASEASVFKALEDSANGLVQIRERFPAVAAFELLLVTDRQIRAGQFTLTPDLANELVTDAIDLPNFYLRYVEF